MFRSTLGALLLAGALVLAGCSASEPVTEPSPASTAETEASGSHYPGWFRSDAPLSSSSTGWSVHSAALGADSAGAADAAVRRGRLYLETELSSELESIRSELAGSGEAAADGLRGSAFILALRKAENGIGALARRGRLEVRLSQEHASRYAFAELTVDKNDLTAHLDTALSEHESAWEAVRSSDSYVNWGAPASE